MLDQGINNSMRARGFITEAHNRSPTITLRHLNNLKQEQRWRKASHQRRIDVCEHQLAALADGAWRIGAYTIVIIALAMILPTRSAASTRCPSARCA